MLWIDKGQPINQAPENVRSISGEGLCDIEKQCALNSWVGGCLAVLVGIGAIFGAGYLTGKYFNSPQIVERDLIGNETYERVLLRENDSALYERIDGLPVKDYVKKTENDRK